MSCKGILIVEDNDDVREGFATVLEYEGYQVHQARNGLVALDFLLSSSQKPGCIILDLMMPVMSGKEFLETLMKEHPDDLCKIPIILATALGSSNDDMSELPCMVEKISKPLDIDQLLSAVQRHCGHAVAVNS